MACSAGEGPCAYTGARPRKRLRKHVRVSSPEGASRTSLKLELSKGHLRVDQLSRNIELEVFLIFHVTSQIGAESTGCNNQLRGSGSGQSLLALVRRWEGRLTKTQDIGANCKHCHSLFLSFFFLFIFFSFLPSVCCHISSASTFEALQGLDRALFPWLPYLVRRTERLE